MIDGGEINIIKNFSDKDSLYSEKSDSESNYTNDSSSDERVWNDKEKIKNKKPRWKFKNCYAIEMTENDLDFNNFFERIYFLYNSDDNIIYTGGLILSDPPKYFGMGIIWNDYQKKIKKKEGLFKYGKLEGEGINYEEDGIIGTKGFFRNGKLNGNGIEYYKNGQIMYEGSWLNNEYSGKGKFYFEEEIYDNNNLKVEYEGQWKKSEYHGYGKLFDYNGNHIYNGEWKRDKKHGFGNEYFNFNELIDVFTKHDGYGTTIKYSGYWLNSEYNGFGTLYNQIGHQIYNGDWKKSKYNGIGTLYNGVGCRLYEGNWIENKKDGEGKEYINNKLHYIGIWKNNLKHGRGQQLFQSKDGIEYLGWWEENKFVNGKIFNENYDLIYDGSIVDGKFSGFGTSYLNPNKGVCYKWNNGKIDKYFSYNSECICLDHIDLNEYTESDVVILKCFHKFHKKCFEDFMEFNHNCPFCRKICKIIDYPK